MRKLLAIFTVFNLFIVSTAFSFPKEIVIIRHADKLLQKEPGPFLSPIGEVRSIKFAYYFLKTFGETDFIIAKNPEVHHGKSSAIRELQTVAPLGNILAMRHKDHSIAFMHPFTKTEFDKLAHAMLSDPKYNNKLILICWDHAHIPDLAKVLGVTQPLKKWHSRNYDTVYDLQYDRSGRISRFSVKERQYPVTFKGSWETLNHLLS
jgi:hypothetical protein